LVEKSQVTEKQHVEEDLHDEEILSLEERRAALESESNQFDESEFSAMETAAQARFTPHHQSRGNYPGWSPSLLELSEEQAPAPVAAVAAAPVPAVSGPVPTLTDVAPVPPSGAVPTLTLPKVTPTPKPDIQRLHIRNGESSAKLKATKGLSKIHVHLYGKEDTNVDQAQRMKNIVKRLAHNQKKSYRKIGKLLKQLEKCNELEDSKACMKKVTYQLEKERELYTPQ